MKLLITLICYFLLCSITLAEERWCKYSDTKGETVFEKICKLERLSQSNCKSESLNGSYKVVFNSLSSARIETTCKLDGLEEIFVNKKRVFLGTVRINEIEYFELIFPESDEMLLLSKAPISHNTSDMNKLPPWWEGTPQASAIDGKCIYVKAGKYKSGDCRQSTVCSHSDEAYEGGCTYSHYFSDESTLIFSGAEESYFIQGGDFSFGLNEITSFLNRTCFPSGYIDERFCFQKDAQMNEDEQHSPKTLWIASRGSEKYLLHGTDGVNYGSAITIEKRGNGEIIWRTEGYITCSNGAVICSILLPSSNGNTGAENEAGAILETISDESGDSIEWVVFAALSQNLYYAGGVKVNPFDETNKIRSERETVPNIFQRLDYTKATTVTIQSFECQDNCYLTGIGKDRASSTYLCQTDLCYTWARSEVSIANILGRNADIFTTTGKQVNSEGEVMSEMEAIQEILIH